MPPHKQTYRLTDKHHAFINALYDVSTVGIIATSTQVAEQTRADLEDARPPYATQLSDASARRLVEGLANHGYISRHALRGGKIGYRLTDSGQAIAMAEVCHA